MRTIDMTKAFTTIIVGAIAFWLPASILSAMDSGSDPGAVLVYSMVLPATTLWAFLRLDGPGRQMLDGSARAFLMLTGIWVMGPIFLVAGLEMGGGFGTFADLPWGMLVNPAATFVMATYQGSLGALLVVTVALPVLAYIRRRRATAERKEAAA
jgi:hypothetical protein